MSTPDRLELTRRALLLVPGAALVAACTSDRNRPAAGSRPAGSSTGPATTPSGAPSGAAATLPPTPACTDNDDETPEQTEGPFFSSGSPQRGSLVESGTTGTPLVVTGLVVTTDCRPIAGAKLDFWQADNAGEYDNSGFRLRGHQFTDGSGRYRLETILPGLYPGRTRHVHVKAQAPGSSVLTTQLYFPGEQRNDADGIYDERLLLAGYQATVAGAHGEFVFVL